MLSTIARKCSVALLCLCLPLVARGGEFKDNSTGVTFPASVSFESEGYSYNLVATGVATREKFFVKVYSVAHYIEDGALAPGGDKFKKILASDRAKQLTMRWVYNVNAARIQEGYQDTFKSILSEASYAKLKPEIKQFLGFFNFDAKKGDELVLRWLPGGTVEVLFNGELKGSLTNNQFANSLWSMWFGSKAVVDKERLASRV